MQTVIVKQDKSYFIKMLFLSGLGKIHILILNGQKFFKKKSSQNMEMMISFSRFCLQI